MTKNTRIIEDYSLYLVITEELCSGRGAPEVAERAIAGGVDIIQMREKARPRNELVSLGRSLRKLCRDSGITFIVNDDPLLAREVNADGVHLGQDDLSRFSIRKARDMLGPERIIGISTDSAAQLEKTNAEDADYVAFGPIFRTTVKNYCVGTGCIRAVQEASRRPVFFIGGIDSSTLSTVLAAGAKNIAMIRAITESLDITATVRYFKDELRKQKESAKT
ncbi:MAG: thiamine phosphate synthase [Candidatus Omnitrophica bacterium]|nr:thiamine phosphate synthase [Candidatus Omnitrophota bacterium]